VPRMILAVMAFMLAAVVVTFMLVFSMVRMTASPISFAILMPNTDRSEQLALCVRAPSGAREEVIVRIMRSVVSQTLGLVSVPSPLPPHVTSTRHFASRIAR